MELHDCVQIALRVALWTVLIALVIGGVGMLVATLTKVTELGVITSFILTGVYGILCED